MVRQIVMPSTFGSIRSSTITSNGSLEQELEPFPAVADGSAVVAGPAQLLGHELADAALVFDQEHPAERPRRRFER